MFRKISPAIALIIILVATFSCKKEEAVDKNARFDVGRTYLEASEGSVFISVTAEGNWTLAIEPEVAWAILDPASGTGNKGDVRLRYEANSSEDERSLNLVLYSGKSAVFRFSITQNGVSEGSGAGNYGYDKAPMNWLELPETVAGDGRELLVHDMKGARYKSRSESGVRNWSCYWDYDDHLSCWVAYPLNRKLIGTGSRSNAWGYDALLPVSIQPNLVGNSYGGGWTRGHQLPSADRLTYAANVSTFVPTNMTPQDYDFNCEIWAGLESKVRSYADKADTLYVVTGCLFDSSSRLTGKDSGFYVKVPTHYYKALLFKGTSTYAHDGYMATAFLLPHSSSISGDDCLDYIMSVDELEKQTGIDFFPNLVAVLGKEKADAIEAESPTKWWQ